MTFPTLICTAAPGRRLQNRRRAVEDKPRVSLASREIIAALDCFGGRSMPRPDGHANWQLIAHGIRTWLVTWTNISQSQPFLRVRRALTV